MKAPTRLLQPIVLAVLAQPFFVACSKATPEPTESSQAPTLTATATATAMAPPTPKTRPVLAPEQLQAACDEHLAKYATINKSVSPTCTATERVLFQKDTSGACLNCLFQGGCLDIAGYPNGRRECGDKGPGAITDGTEDQCVDTLRCLVGAPADGTTRTSPAHGLAIDAFCGTQKILANCSGSPGPNGTCAAVEKAGFPAGSSNGWIMDKYGIRQYASGMANAVLVCAYANSCKTCNE
jgi:hypothetical protein